MQKKIEIPFLKIDSIPSLIKDFLRGDLSDFSENCFNINNIKTAIDRKKIHYTQEKRNTLARVLAHQYEHFDLSDLQKKNLNSLQNENTFSVVTGHQLNLFSGPSFFVYKILQTIKTVEYINKHLPDYYVVPIFWMASEDHDFEEINHFKTDLNHYEIKGHSGGPVGRIKVESNLFIHEFEKDFRDFVFGTELIEQLKAIYSKGKTLTEATKELAQWLFAEYGLLCIDGDDAELKSQMICIFKDELIHQRLKNESTKKVDYLTEKYGKVQVNPREINLFYLSENRNRIGFRNGKYHIVDTDKLFSEAEVLAELEKNPQNFSPNAVMRPVYQENVLPNLAYIGGNAEVAYWLELKDYFRFLEVPFPILVPRNSMLFLSEKTFNKIEKLGMKITDFFRNFANVVKEQLINNHPLDSLLKSQEQLLKQHFEELKDKAELTDISFRNLVAAEEVRQLKSFQRMQKRLLRAEKIKQNERLQRMETLFYEIHPNRVWQERVYNFSVFYANEGKNWIAKCYNTMDVEKSQLIINEI